MRETFDVWPQLWPSLILCGVPLCLAWLADKVFKSRAAVRSLRLRAALLATIALAIVPLLPLQLPRPSWLPAPIVARSIEVSAPVIASISEAEPPLLQQDTNPVGTQTPLQLEPATPRKYSQRDSALHWTQIVTGIWLLGALLLLSWSAFCHAHIARLRGRSQVLAEGKLFDAATEIARDWKMQAPRLLQTPTINSPFAVGVWQRAICWPANFRADNESASWRAILRHEMAHCRRHDCAWNALAQTARALLWPQPLLWWACRAIRRNAEDVCDEAALENCAPTIYARGLLDLSQNTAASTCSATRTASAGAVPSQPELSRRVAAILRPGARDAWRVGWRTRVATIVALSLVLGFGAVFSCAPSPESKAAASTSEEAKAPVKIDLSTPQATLDTFVAALKAGDARALVACVETQNSAQDLESFAQDLNVFADKLFVSQWNIEQQGDSATAHARLELAFPRGFSQKTDTQLTLKKSDGQWKIISRPEQPQYGNSLMSIVEIIADPKFKRLNQWLQAHDNAALEGQVLLTDGSPAANVTILAQIRKFPHPPELNGISTFFQTSALPRSTHIAIASTDQNGKYHIDGLIGTTYSVSAYLPATLQTPPKPYFETDFDAKQIARAQEITAQEGQTIQAPLLKMQPTVPIEVQTLDTRSGKPLQGLIYIANIGLSANIAGKMAEDGHIILNVPPGKATLHLMANHDGHSPTAAATSRGLYSTIHNATVQLENGPQIPFPGTTTVTVEANRPRKVTVRLASLNDMKAALIEPRLKAPANGIGTGVIAGRVQNADGSAAPNVEITAQMPSVAQRDILQNEGLSSGIPTTASLQRKRQITPLFEQRRAVSDQSGNFRLQGLTTAPYLVVARAVDKKTVSAAREKIWVEQGHTTQLAQPFVMSAGALVRGRVTDDVNGEGIGNVLVTFSGPNRPISNGDTVRTKADGSFALRVTPGTNEIYFGGPFRSNQTPYQIISTGQKYSGDVLKFSNQRIYQGRKFQYQIDGGAAMHSEFIMTLTTREGEKRTLNIQLARLKLAK